MFIRQTKTSTAKSGQPYYTYRLVTSERIGEKVRQKTLLNLGKNFSLPKESWPQLCVRIEQILSGQMGLIEVDETIESLAQHYAAQLITQGPKSLSEKTDYQEVDVNSLELVRPRSIGVEHVGLEALKSLNLAQILKDVGLNGIQQAIAMGSIIGRMAKPGSELATWHWLRQISGLGELLGVDFEKVPLMSLYRVSDSLLKQRDAIEDALFQQISNLFSLSATVTLYDLTNTYFEGEMAKNSKAKRARSKEKRNDCPLVTLGLVLNGSGFVRRSRMFKGNAVESFTLQEMLKDLDAPAGAMVIMDRGIATKDNICFLVENGYRYVVVSRERHRCFDEDESKEIVTASNQTIRLKRVVNDEGTEVRLYCHSLKRQEKEDAIIKQFANRFEQGLAKLSASLSKGHTMKKRDRILQKIGRLIEKTGGIGRHYQINLIPETGDTLSSITWEQRPIDGSMLTHPGVYCLRSNELSWDEERLWRTYSMLTDLEAVFRSLKSELGLRPVYHHNEKRADGHLFITVLAYQAVQILRSKLAQHNVTFSWCTLRDIFSLQQRVTATFSQRDGRTLNVRKATVAEPNLKKLYDLLGISATPGGVQRYIN